MRWSYRWAILFSVIAAKGSLSQRSASTCALSAHGMFICRPQSEGVLHFVSFCVSLVDYRVEKYWHKWHVLPSEADGWRVKMEDGIVSRTLCGSQPHCNTCIFIYIHICIYLCCVYICFNLITQSGVCFCNWLKALPLIVSICQGIVWMRSPITDVASGQLGFSWFNWIYDMSQIQTSSRVRCTDSLITPH